jgi:hypothetical protein
MLLSLNLGDPGVSSGISLEASLGFIRRQIDAVKLTPDEAQTCGVRRGPGAAGTILKVHGARLLILFLQGLIKDISIIVQR